MAEARGLSRRRFLIISGGGAAALWAAQPGLAQALQPGRLLGPATAAPPFRLLPFADDFGDATLAQWNVRRSVAILGATSFGLDRPTNGTLDRADFLAGRGTVIGMDGPLGASTGPGLMETVDTFVFEPGATYVLRFTVAGSHQGADRMPLSSVSASLPGLGATTSVARMPADDFLEFSLEVPVARRALSTIVLASGDAPGQAGVLLESVSLSKRD